MRLAAVIGTAVSFCALASVALAQGTTTISPLAQSRVERNRTVAIDITPPPTAAVRIKFVPFAEGLSTSCATNDAEALAAVSATGAWFTVPPRQPAKQYLLCLKIGTQDWLPVPTSGAPFEVISGSATLTSAQPAVAFPNLAKSYRLWLYGSNFSPIESENVLEIKGRHITPECPQDFCAPTRLEFVISEQPETGQPPGRVGGVESLRLIVGTGLPSDPRDVTFAYVTEEKARLYSALISSALIAIVLTLVVVGLKSTGTVSGGGVFQALLLDADGQSYSLSKFQFLVWTIAAVGGYVFLALAWSLIQGRLDLPPVPEGLPGIVAISAVTAVTAVAASQAKGPKGGNPKPSVSDFIMVGGRVVAERLQFFVWTIVSVLTFAVAVSTTDPATITTLPRVPDGLLFLMGISAAGYLGGKFVRGSAPSIESAPAAIDNQNLVITPNGRHLSKDARIVVDGRFIPAKDDAARTSDPHRLIEGLEVDPEAAMGYFKKVKITIVNPDPMWTKESHVLTFVNPDQQLASATFDATKPPTLLFRI